MDHDHPSLQMIREFVAIGRSTFDRPTTERGDPTAQIALIEGLEVRDDDGRRIDVAGPLAELLAPRAPFFDGAVMAAVRHGTAQVVNIGAGLDDRALRFAHPDVKFFEADFPPVVEDKKKRIRAAGHDTDALTFVPIDLSQASMRDALLAAGLRQDRPTLFLCEHVLLFIEEPCVRRLLTDIGSIAAPGSVLAVTVETHPPGLATRTVIADVARVMFNGENVVRCIQSVDTWRNMLSGSGWHIDASKGFAIDHFSMPAGSSKVTIQTCFIRADAADR